MNYTITIIIIKHRIAISCISLTLSVLLIGSPIGNAIITHQASAQTIIIITINNKKSSPYTSINTMLDLGPPDKMTIPFYSQQHPTVLSDTKKQELMQHNQPSPSLPSSGKSIQRPTPGTQTSLP